MDVITGDDGKAYAFVRPTDASMDVYVGRGPVQSLNLRVDDVIEFLPTEDLAGRRRWAAKVVRVEA